MIKCGSLTTDGSGNATVSLGWEPQWVLIKQTNGSGQWILGDTMRGLIVDGSAGNDKRLFPNLSNAETDGPIVDPTATGFYLTGAIGANADVIYIAIRRGPMKTPTSGTSVFSPNAVTGNALVTTNFPVDSAWIDDRGGGSTLVTDRLRGSSQTYYNNLSTTSTAAENTGTGAGLGFDNNTGYQMNAWGGTSQANINWNFRRAPGFFDVVCYTGTGVARTITHNLGVAPEMLVVRSRNITGSWVTQVSSLGPTKYIRFDSNGAAGTVDIWNDTSPTSTVFSVKTDPWVNGLTTTYVAYLFASVAGVSKVGSYTGNGSSQTINCGFTGGARFVLLKATSTTGDWVVFDSARGIVSGNDPYLRLNSAAAEVTDKDAVDTDSTGFVVNETTGPNINTNGVTYIYLAIA